MPADGRWWTMVNWTCKMMTEARSTLGIYTECVSEMGDFATLFYWFGITGAAIAILLPNLKRLSCNGAVDWSTRCFCCESVLQKRWSFVFAQREFRRHFGIHRNPTLPSSHAIKTWVRNFEATGSTLKKKCGSVKTVRTAENIAVVREAI